MSKTYTDTFTRADGALGSIPGGPAWSVLSGAFSVSGNRALSSTAPDQNPLAVVDLGHPMLEVSAKPNHTQGNALYARVVDANNWYRIRARYWTSSYQYYVTEYQHTTYVTEYEWSYINREYKQYDAITQYEYRMFIDYTYGSWSSWSTYQTTGCRSSPPTLPTDNDTTQYQYTVAGSGSSVGCNNNPLQYKYNLQSRTRTRTANYNYQWNQNDPGTNWNATGNSRVIDQWNGTYYWARSPADGNDVATGVTSVYFYWAQTKAVPTDTATGNSRQTASGSYWDQTYEAGAPTRQAGPYTGTNYNRDLVLEKNLAGTITTLGTYSGLAASPTSMRLRVIRDSLSVFVGGSNPVLTAVDSSLMAATKVGMGGGVSDYSPLNPDWDDFNASIVGLYVHDGTQLIPTAPRSYNGSAFVARGRITA